MPSTPKKKKTTTASAEKRSARRRRRKSEEDASAESSVEKVTASSSVETAIVSNRRSSPRRSKTGRKKEEQTTTSEDVGKVLDISENDLKEETPRSSSKPSTRSSPSPKRRKQSKKKETPATSAADESPVEKETGKKRSRSNSSLSQEPSEETNDEVAVVAMEQQQPQKPTMDVRVHRLRHLEYIPSPILSIAAAPNEEGDSNNNNNGFLAISREDGSYQLSVVSTVEEYPNQYASHVYPVAHVAGSKLAVAHSLCWVPNTTSNSSSNSDEGSVSKPPTCVAASPDGTLWVVNFAQSQLQCRLSSGGGGIFDLITCHSSNLPVVAAACEDGFIRLWQILPNGTIRDPPIAALTTAGSAILSLAWRLTTRQRNGTHETVLFAGVADGTIRKFKVDLTWENDIVEMKKHVSVSRMTMESKGRRQTTKVWTMKVLQDGTLISGNSLGQVQFWNSDTGTLIQSIFQSNLKSDVLQLAVNKEESKVFCTGVDSRVVCCERPKSKNPAKQANPWVLTNAQRPHTHDIKAMAIVTSDDGRIETLATGGVDTKLCSYVVPEFSKRRPQVWYPWPSDSPISTSAGHRVVSMQRKALVELYRLDSGDSATRKSASDLVGTIQVQTKTNLVASSLSPNGKWMAISDASSLFAFSMKLNKDETSFQPKKLKLPEKLSAIAATAIHFDQDVLYLVESSTSSMYVVDMTTMDHSVLSINTSTDSSDRLPIVSIHTRGDYLVTLSHTRSSGVNVFRRTAASTIAYKSYWTLPSLSRARVAAVTLIEGGLMAVATYTSQVYLFDLDAKKLNPWSEKNGFPIEKWPPELASRKEFPIRLISNPSDPDQLILYGCSFYGPMLACHPCKKNCPTFARRYDASFGTFCVLNIKGELPHYCKTLPEAHVRRRKRRGFNPKNQDPNSRNCIIGLHYNSMLYMNFLGPKEMVVVEQPWLQVVATFPEAVQRRVYGVH
eukprot:scaffold3533_cov97-Cylindrotheca_fusiformis.AAC.1